MAAAPRKARSNLVKGSGKLAHTVIFFFWGGGGGQNFNTACQKVLRVDII